MSANSSSSFASSDSSSHPDSHAANGDSSSSDSNYPSGASIQRSTSAPPQLNFLGDSIISTASLSGTPTPISINGETVLSNDPRLTPEYYHYYYSQRPLDPRLPVPLVNWANHHPLAKSSRIAFLDQRNAGSQQGDDDSGVDGKIVDGSSGGSALSAETNPALAALEPTGSNSSSPFLSAAEVQAAMEEFDLNKQSKGLRGSQTQPAAQSQSGQQQKSGASPTSRPSRPSNPLMAVMGFGALSGVQPQSPPLSSQSSAGSAGSPQFTGLGMSAASGLYGAALSEGQLPASDASDSSSSYSDSASSASAAPVNPVNYQGWQGGINQPSKAADQFNPYAQPYFDGSGSSLHSYGGSHAPNAFPRHDGQSRDGFGGQQFYSSRGGKRGGKQQFHKQQFEQSNGAPGGNRNRGPRGNPNRFPGPALGGVSYPSQGQPPQVQGQWNRRSPQVHPHPHSSHPHHGGSMKHFGPASHTTSLLELLDSNPTYPRLLLAIATDQHGSRILQQRLEFGSDAERALAFEHLSGDLVRLSTDVFGNYVVQKLLEFGSVAQRSAIAQQLQGNCLRLAYEMYGCRVMQKAIEVCDLNSQLNILNELVIDIVPAVQDAHANHVVQQAIARIPPQFLSAITEALTKQYSMLASHPFGCRVIQRLFEHTLDSQKEAIQSEILLHLEEMCKHPYGNYVVQHILLYGSSKSKAIVFQFVRSRLLPLSKHKFASNIVESTFVHASPADKLTFIDEILGREVDQKNNTVPIPLPPSLASSVPNAVRVSTPSNPNAARPWGCFLAMVRDHFGNYVVQRLLDATDGELRQNVIQRIRVQGHALRLVPYGKVVISKIESLTGEAFTPAKDLPPLGIAVQKDSHEGSPALTGAPEPSI